MVAMVATGDADSLLPPPLSGAQIRAAREACGLSLRELGAQLGYSHTAIGSWEHDTTCVPRAVVPQLLAILQAAADEQRQYVLLDQIAAATGDGGRQTVRRRVVV